MSPDLRHVSTLMEPPDYRSLAPEELLHPRPQHLLSATTTYLDVVYARPVGWRPLTLDLHLPKNDKGPFPLVVYIHGGSFVAGIKAMGPWGVLPRMGIAVASVSYRLSGEAQFPEPVEDVRAAIRWARANAGSFNIEPQAIALWGSSAGAYLSTMAGILGDDGLGRPIGDHQHSSADVTGIVSHYGISDFGKLGEDALENESQQTVMLQAAVRQFLGFDPMDGSRELRSTQPLELARKKQNVPPFFIMHGDQDYRVGQGQSLRLHRGLLEVGHQSTFVSVPGADHGDEAFSSLPATQKAVRFLRSTWERA
ncbi:alpha/beta hydrolase [Paenarthrobacter aurescens]|jgi:acetyl esterase/lipase|uniref:Lipase/esterase protein n=1 Tax=Paenarthrobacter aurescens (strain TC1) TaxID=290340 RepID=A1RDH1_PAEAT|nr:alpha/beta hydrolase [Paenarthrobacter aurescens]ABM10617.1 putative Lipase/esterase protein [Paenarthrobacter aurescens TC1]